MVGILNFFHLVQSQIFPAKVLYPNPTLQEIFCPAKSTFNQVNHTYSGFERGMGNAA